MHSTLVAALVTFSLAAAPAKPAPAKHTKGSLSKAEVQKVIKEHKDEVHTCYADALKTDKTLGGKIIVRFTVDPDGNATEAKSTGPKKLKPVADCVVSKVTTWKFPKPKGGSVDVAYPFTFANKK